MSNFYNLETDLEAEDVVSSGEESYEEEYEEITDFGDYSEADAEARWGSMDFDQLVVEMESIISRSKRYFFSRTKKVVNGEDLKQLAQYIQKKLPTEIIAAKEIMTNQVAIIDEANRRKSEILAEAHKEENETVGRAKQYYSTTVQKAKDDAAGIVAHATEQATAMVMEDNIYKLAKEGKTGCTTVFDIAPAYLSPLDGATLRKELL